MAHIRYLVLPGLYLTLELLDLVIQDKLELFQLGHQDNGRSGSLMGIDSDAGRPEGTFNVAAPHNFEASTVCFIAQKTGTIAYQTVRAQRERSAIETTEDA